MAFQFLWKSDACHLLEIVMSGRKAPGPQLQPLSDILAERCVRQTLGNSFCPTGFPEIECQQLPWITPWIASSVMSGQSTPISSPLLPRWLGDTGKQSGQQLGWLSWSTAPLCAQQAKATSGLRVTVSIPIAATHHLLEAGNSLRRPKV